MNDLIDQLRRPGMSRQPNGLLDLPVDMSAQTPFEMAAGWTPPPAPTPVRDQFDFTPSDAQQKQALFSSLARMGAAMLANNRGPNAFATALGHGLGAQQEGYQNALQTSEAANTNALKSNMLRTQYGEEQRKLTLQQGLRTALGKLDQNDPDYWGNVGRLYAAAGDMDTALKAQEVAGGGKPTDAIKNYKFLLGQGDTPQHAAGVFTPFAPPALQYGAPTETRGGYVFNPKTGERNFVEPPIAPKPKDIPPTALKAVADNRATLTKYDNTISALENEIKNGGVALGTRNYLPDAVRQRSDPEGNALRAAIAEVGGQVMHDRSGAAVSVGEMARLKPYIPNLTDDPQTALTKLKMLRANVANETNALAEMYPADQGYKPLTPWNSPRSAPAPKAATAPAASAPQARQAPPSPKAAFGSMVGQDKARQAYEQSQAQGKFSGSYEQFVSVLKQNGVRVQ